MVSGSRFCVDQNEHNILKATNERGNWESHDRLRLEISWQREEEECSKSYHNHRHNHLLCCHHHHHRQQEQQSLSFVGLKDRLEIEHLTISLHLFRFCANVFDSVNDLPVQISAHIFRCLPFFCQMWSLLDEIGINVGSYDVAIPFQQSLLDSEYKFLRCICFLLCLMLSFIFRLFSISRCNLKIYLFFNVIRFVKKYLNYRYFIFIIRF